MFSDKQPRKNLSQLEHLVMDTLWAERSATSERIREALAPTHPMKESTVRTVLRRLEEKGYVKHSVEGRTYVYEGFETPRNVAARTVRQIIDRLCGGSLEQLLVGMVESEMIDRAELERLAGKVARDPERKRKQ